MENNFYHKIATCVLKGCEVDYSPGGVKSFASGAPTQIKMGLNFMETEMLTKEHVNQAIDAAMAAKEQWISLSWEHRASIFLKAADLLAGPYRAKINAATMLGQSKNSFQAEIDAAAIPMTTTGRTPIPPQLAELVVTTRAQTPQNFWAHLLN